ncbi:MAG: hypothetical protein JO138_26655 [Acidobacteriaceae bacterium]|nr:hypothetical protein [Acidobacteriaceae bacterium]
MFAIAFQSRQGFLLAISFIVSALVFIALADRASAEPIPVKEKQGAMYAFLVLKSPDGRVIADGDQVETIDGDKVRSRVIFRFRDGSIDDESSVYTQGAVFRLLTDHHIQKGPSFPDPVDLSINASGRTVRFRVAKTGKEKVQTEHMDLPSDLVNGLTSLVVENFPKNQAEMKVSYLAGSSKPRLVTLLVKPDGEDVYRIGGVIRHSKKFKVHIEIGGIAGVIAPLIGKQPSDIEMWVSEGEVPIFLKMVGPLYANGPIWTTEIACPTWSK